MRSVDERVVEMRFDNKEFESGVRESMSTLNRFESSLDGLGSTRSIDGINKGIAGINFGPLQNGLELAGQKFSALETIAVGALMRIGSKITDYVAQQFNELTIAPVKQGFDEYELKMGAVQTMMASTGEDLSVINGYLEELNHYADKTIYSFSDMTQNIGKFTNNGVKLKDAVSAIQGISNAAAVAGANSNEASRAMYNFSQALSQGSVKLIDWKSIQNANMATVDFKQNLIDTAVAMGTLVKEGNQYVSTTTDLNGKVSQAFDANKMFNESLSASWMTTEVLVQTLQNYSTDVREMSEAEKAEYETKLKSIGYTDEQVKSITALGSKAADAAQEVKTFSQLLDTLKEAVGSGWTETFELIFGDFEEAKKLWTSVNNFIDPIISSISDSRNQMLKEWRETGGRDDLFAGIAAGFNNVKDIFLSIKGVWDQVFPKERFADLKKAISGPDGMTMYVGKGAHILTEISKKFKEFGEGLKPSKDTLNDIKDTFRGVFSLLSIGKKIIKSVFNAVKPSVGLIKNVGKEILGVTANIGRFLADLDKGFNSDSSFGIFVSDIAEAVDVFISELSEFKESFEEWGGGLRGLVATVLNEALVAPFYFIGRVIGVILGKTDQELVMFAHKFEEPAQFIRNIVVKIIDAISNLSGFKFKMPDLSPIGEFIDRTQKRLNPLEKIWQTLKAFFTGLADFLKPVGDVLVDAGKRVGSAIWGMIDKLLTMMTEGDFDGLFDIVNSGVLTLFGVQMLKMSGSLNKAAAAFSGKENPLSFVNIIEAIKDPEKALGGIGDGLKELVGGILPLQKEAEPDGLKQIAEAIGILSASLLVLSLIDSESLGQSVMAITALFADLVGTVKLMQGMELASAGLVKVAVSVLILTAAIKSLAELDHKQLIIGLTGLKGAIYVMITSFKQMSGLDVKGVAGSILVFSLAMVVMGAALHILGSLKLDALGKSLLAFAGSMAIIIASFKLLKGGDFMAIAGAIFIVSEAMMRMGIALRIMGGMNFKQMGIALLSFAGTMTVIVAAFKMIRLYDLIPVAGAIFILSEAMMRMGIALRILGAMSWKQMGVALISFAVAMGVVVATFKLLKGDDIIKLSAAILILSFAMTQMGIALQIMGHMRLDQMIIALVSFAGVMGIFVGMVELMDSSAGRMAGVAASLIVLSIGLTNLAIAMQLLGMLSLGDIIKSLVVMAGTLAILGGAAVLLQPVIPMMALLGAAFAAAGAGLLLFGLGLTSLAVGIAATVALLDVGVEAIILALEILIVGTLNAIANSVDAIVAVFKAIVNAIIVVVRDSIPDIVDVTLFAIASIVESLLKYLPTAVEGLLVVLDQLMQSLSVHVPVLVGYLVDLIVNVINTLAEKIPFFVNAVVNLIRSFIDAVINALNGLDMENLKNGIIAFGMMSIFMGALSGAAAMAPAAMAGVLAVGAVIAEMALVLAAIGALNKIPGLAEFAESGGDLLQIVGEGIGKFLGGIIGGVAEGVMSALPQMGTYLSEFMANVQPFIEGASMIDPAAMDGVASLVGVMMLLTAAELLDQLVGWIAGDTGSALADFGDELIEFAPKLVEFGEKVKDINAEQVKGAADATLALAEMASKIPNSGGLLGAITGENSLREFGSELVLYAPNLVRFVNIIEGTDISEEKIRGAADATIALAEMAKKIPNAGGLVAMITGENSLSAFGLELKMFGPYLVDFADTVSGVTLKQLQGAIDACLGLVDMASKIPNTGGLLALVTGDNSLSGFGKEMADFGYYLKLFSDGVVDVNTSRVGMVATATEKLVDMAAKIPKTGGLLESVTGKNSLSGFGKELEDFGVHLSKYSEKVQDISLDMVTGSIDATDKLITMATGVTNGSGGIAAIISGGNSLSEFGKELSGYAPNLVEFAKKVSEAGINKQSVQGAADATETLGKMTESLPKTDGWVNAILGKNSVSSFGKELAGYGQPLAEFAEAVNGKVNETMISGAVDATIKLAEMSKDIPATDGLVQRITGKNSLASFGEELAAYGPNLEAFAGKVNGINKDDVIGAAQATGELTKMAQNIPFEGGLVERITGKNSLADFGEELEDYGYSLKDFAKDVEGVTLNQVKGAIDATIEIADMAGHIPYENLTKLIGGKASLSSFGEELEDFGDPLSNFVDSVRDVPPGFGTTAKEIANATTELMNGLPVISARVDFEALGDQLRSFGRDFNKFYSRIADVDTAKFTAVVDGLNALSKISKDISNINGKGLVQLASGMSDISTEGVTGFVSSFTSSAGSVKDSAAGMVGGAIDGILSMGHSLFTVVSSIGTGIVNTFQQSIPYQIFKSITENQFILAIISAINGKRGQIVSAVSTVGSDIVTQLRNNLNSSTIFNLGLMVPKGLSDGMLAGLPQLNATASRMGQIVSDAIRNRLKIHSPSEETYDDGAYVILGAINGMEAYADRLKTTTEDITEQSMLDPIREAIASVNDDGTIDSETQPVIRPVLDLSEIQNGYKQINSLFDDQYRVDMQARMGRMETSSAINPEQIDQIEDAIRSINNDDVINEMETLRNDISNLKDAMTRLQVVMNSGTLVGELVDPMDAALGMKALQNSRGRY